MVCIITGPFISLALLNISTIVGISWPSIGPIYFIPISSNNIEGTTNCLTLSFNFDNEWITAFPTELLPKLELISILSLLYPGSILNLLRYDDIPPTFGDIDIWLSFKTIIISVLLKPTSFNASMAIPPVKAPSPITATTL